MSSSNTAPSTALGHGSRSAIWKARPWPFVSVSGRALRPAQSWVPPGAQVGVSVALADVLDRDGRPIGIAHWPRNRNEARLRRFLYSAVQHVSRDTWRVQMR